MRKFKSVVWGIIALSLFLSPELARAQGNFKQPAALHCLWKAQGASNVVYLLGSVHLLQASNYPLPAIIDSAFTNSQIAAFETDIDKMDDPVQQAAMLSKISLPEGQTLQQNLSPKVYAALSKHAAEVGLPLQALEQYRPAVAIMTLEMMELMTIGADPEFGVDKHFINLARESGKRVIPLETIDFQIGLLTGFTKAEEDLMVEKSLDEIDDEK
ncbi:MAG TPA: TraB/GumN family protein, partial [Verrucomicrobiae bacterium]|nr:TraB/GumN family protein [Verrucomicrobiae bacterium]